MHGTNTVIPCQLLFFSYLHFINFAGISLDIKKACTINDWSDICGDRLTTVSVHVCARAVEKTDARVSRHNFTFYADNASFINHLVLYLEEKTKRAGGLSVNGSEASS